MKENGCDIISIIATGITTGRMTEYLCQFFFAKIIRKINPSSKGNRYVMQ